MTKENSPGRREALDQVSAARRAATLRFAIAQQERGHYAEAQQAYGRLIEQYPGTDEEAEARERMLDIAHLFASGNQTYRMLGIYDTLESLYARQEAPNAAEARRERVREIVDDIHRRDRRETEAETGPPATLQNEEPPWKETVDPPQQIAARRRPLSTGDPTASPLNRRRASGEGGRLR